MRVVKYLFLILGILCFAVIALAQSTKTTTEIFTVGTVRMIRYNWHLYNSSGVDSCISTKAISGKVVGLVTVPGEGSSIPSDNWDLEIKDENGIDILWGLGANRDSAATAYIIADSLGYIVQSKLVFLITNGGAYGDSGAIYLYIQ